MAYLACPNCKQIKIEWPDSNVEFTNHILKTQSGFGLPCAECFAERKVVPGDAPKTCKHGRPVTIKCHECKAMSEYDDGDCLDFNGDKK